MGAFGAEVERWLTRGDASFVRAYVGSERSWQTSSRLAAVDLLSRLKRDRPLRLIDLGCGTGSSHELLAVPGVTLRWVGVDIPQSPEVGQRTRRDLDFVVFDGRRLPIADGAAEFVYSHQVLEHVRHPAELLCEAARILSTDGWLVGSTSQLEPFHSCSTFNYTPYGLAELLRAAGFEWIELRPGIDGLTLTTRRVFSFVKLEWMFELFFEHESPLNLLIEIAGRIVGLSKQTRALLKLVFAGQFIFLARKTSPAAAIGRIA